MTAKVFAFASVVRADSKPGYTTLVGIVSEEAKRTRLETARIRRMCDDQADWPKITELAYIDILAN